MRRRSAAFELTALAVAILAALLGAYTFLSLRWERAWLLDEAQRSLSLASSTLHSSLRNGMMHNRPDDIRTSIRRVAAETEIGPIRVINHEGRVVASSQLNDDLLGKTTAIGSPKCSFCHEGAGERVVAGVMPRTVRIRVDGKTMHSYTPVLSEPGCAVGGCHGPDRVMLGLLEAEMSLAGAHAALDRSRFRLVALFLAALAVGGFLLALLLARRFRRPVRDLLNGMRRVTEGDLKHEIRTRSHNEFGDLAGAFNRMSAAVTEAQHELIQSERLISMGTLAAGVAHEMNNPLTGIITFAEDLVEHAAPEDPLREDYQVIMREAMRCRQIVRDLLDFSRQGEPEFKPVQLATLVERSVAVVRRQTAFRTIELVVEIGEGLPLVNADSVQIQQVIVNLVVNAQQAMPDGGKITVAVRLVESGDQVELSVADEGEGVPEEVAESIFEPFFSTKGVGGHGLGLAVCSGIVQQHDGTIALESEPGVGSTFKVRLPLD